MGSSPVWRFLLDENISRRVEEELESRGYEAEHVVEALNPGVDDLSDIIPYAQREALVTTVSRTLSRSFLPLDVSKFIQPPVRRETA